MSRVRRISLSLLLSVLAVELVDELVDGAGRAALPLIRTEFQLSYTQIGTLLGVPALIAAFIEPFLGVAADVWKRRVIVLGGGVLFTMSVGATAAAPGFLVLLGAFIVFYPSSGAFVSLSQASLMDADPARREQNMARWTVAGYTGNIGGPILLAAMVAAGTGWRGAYGAIAVLSLFALLRMTRFPFAARHPDVHPSMIRGLLDALKQLRRREVLRWLVLLDASDLMLDILAGFLALYLVDVVGLPVPQTAIVIAAMTGAGLLGELFVVWVLERVPGLRYIRWSVAAAGLLYPALLLAPSTAAKIVAALGVGFSTAGWYSVLQAQLYGAMPERSGTTMTVGNVAGLVWSLVPIGLGAIAERFGLPVTMWLLLAAVPILLLGTAGPAKVVRGPKNRAD